MRPDVRSGHVRRTRSRPRTRTSALAVLRPAGPRTRPRRRRACASRLATSARRAQSSQPSALAQAGQRRQLTGSVSIALPHADRGHTRGRSARRRPSWPAARREMPHRARPRGAARGAPPARRDRDAERAGARARGRRGVPTVSASRRPPDVDRDDGNVPAGKRPSRRAEVAGAGHPGTGASRGASDFQSDTIPRTRRGTGRSRTWSRTPGARPLHGLSACRSTYGRMPPWRRYSRSRGVSRRTRRAELLVVGAHRHLVAPRRRRRRRSRTPRGRSARATRGVSPSRNCSGRMPIISRFERWMRS